MLHSAPLRTTVGAAWPHVLAPAVGIQGFKTLGLFLGLSCSIGVQGNEWQAPDAAQHGALFIILAAHLMPLFPPHYVVYQTEQWGHAVLAEGNRVWGPPHHGSVRRDWDVFRGAVEASSLSCFQCLASSYANMDNDTNDSI